MLLTVKSAVRVLRIFEHLSQKQKGLTMKELSDELSLPQSSTFALTQTLLGEGYLTKGSSNKYKLGPKLISVGESAKESLDLYSQGDLALTHLMEEVKETVFMAILSKYDLVYINKINSNRSIQMDAQLGHEKPLYCTGLGKALLAFLPKKKREYILNEVDLVAITEKTITNRNKLEKQLDLYARQGYAIDDGESEEGLYCLAAPVFDHTGEVIAAISVAGPRERILVQQNKIVNKLLLTADTISKNIGYYS